MRVLLLAAIPFMLAAAGPSITPGMWESSVRVESMKIPNLPPELAKSLGGQTHTVRNCVKPGDAEKTPERVFAASSGKCRYSNFSMAGGQMRGTLTCQGGVTAEMSGRYTPTSYDATSRTTTQGGMTSTALVRGRRVGDC